MKARLLLLAAVSLLPLAAGAEVVVFEEGFGTPISATDCSPAFPAGWTRHDVDGLPVNSHPGVSWVTDAWVTGVDEFDDTNCMAVSTSWYEKPGVSDDWMITPLVHVPEHSTISWRAYAPLAPKYADDYQVLVSTTGTAPADFTALAPTFTDEPGVWTGHAIDLDAAGIGGRAAYFAFRNVANDEYLLSVDDVKIAFDNTLLEEEFGGVDGNGKCAPLFPADWTRLNVDNKTPESTVAFMGSQAWVARNENWATETLAECVAMSTSSYQPAGTADDWLITSVIALPFVADLAWRAQADDAAFPDGYEVLWSSGGAAPADFAGHSLFSIAAENADWTARKVDLDAAGLGGQSIRLAFRNHSTDEFLLLVDSIEVSVPTIFRDGFDGGFAGAWSAASGLLP